MTLSDVRGLPSRAAKLVKDFCNDLNTTSFGKVNTEILWYLTMPWCYLIGLLLPQGTAEFLVGTWLAALCGKSGFDFVRYRTDRNTQFTPQENAAADVLHAQAETIRQANPEQSVELIKAVTLPAPQVVDPPPNSTSSSTSSTDGKNTSNTTSTTTGTK